MGHVTCQPALADDTQTVTVLEYACSLQKIDGLTETYHGAIFKEVKELMMVDPGSLLSKH